MVPEQDHFTAAPVNASLSPCDYGEGYKGKHEGTQQFSLPPIPVSLTNTQPLYSSFSAAPITSWMVQHIQ